MIKNATIRSTRLGTQHTDHGIQSFYINLDFDGEAQSFGGQILDASRNGVRVPTTRLSSLLLAVGRVFAVDWEGLPGLPCRAYERQGRIIAIGHYLKDRWVSTDPGDFCVVTQEDLASRQE